MNNKNTNLLKRITGFAAVVSIAILLLSIFYSITNIDSQKEYFNNENITDYSWEYYSWNGQTEQIVHPNIIDDEKVSFTSPDGMYALKITKTLHHDLKESQLKISPMGLSTEIFVDGKLKYSDFECKQLEEHLYEHDHLTQSQLKFDKDISLFFTLPNNISGKTITIIYYFPYKIKTCELERKQFPNVLVGAGNPAGLIKGAVVPSLVAAECVLLVIILLAMFLYGLHDSNYEWHLLFLVGYYVTLILRILCISDLKNYTIFVNQIDPVVMKGIGFLSLLMFLSIWLYNGWLRVAALSTVLCTEVIFFVLYVLKIHHVTNIHVRTGHIVILVVFALFGVFSYLQNRKHHKTRITSHFFTKALKVVMAFSLVSLTDSLMKNSYYEYWMMIINELKAGEVNSIVRLVTETIAIWVTIALIHKFITQILDAKQWMTTYQIRSQMAIEREQHVRESINQAREMRHEMRHHIITLSGLLDRKEYDVATEYVRTLEEDVEKMTPIRFSSNMLVNTIVSAFMTRLKKKDIEAEIEINLPEHINMVDTDISMLLTNILENAMEACEKVENNPKIHLSMNLENNMLFLKERNTVKEKHVIGDGTTLISTKENRIFHGYGLGVIKKIVKKYDGDFKIDIQGEEFALNIYLNIKNSK